MHERDTDNRFSEESSSADRRIEESLRGIANMQKMEDEGGKTTPTMRRIYWSILTSGLRNAQIDSDSIPLREKGMEVFVRKVRSRAGRGKEIIINGIDRLRARHA